MIKPKQYNILHIQSLKYTLMFTHPDPTAAHTPLHKSLLPHTVLSTHPNIPTHWKRKENPIQNSLSNLLWQNVCPWVNIIIWFVDFSFVLPLAWWKLFLYNVCVLASPPPSAQSSHTYHRGEPVVANLDKGKDPVFSIVRKLNDHYQREINLLIFSSTVFLMRLTTLLWTPPQVPGHVSNNTNSKIKNLAPSTHLPTYFLLPMSHCSWLVTKPWRRL